MELGSRKRLTTTWKSELTFTMRNSFFGEFMTFHKRSAVLIVLSCVSKTRTDLGCVPYLLLHGGKRFCV